MFLGCKCSSLQGSQQLGDLNSELLTPQKVHLHFMGVLLRYIEYIQQISRPHSSPLSQLLLRRMEAPEFASDGLKIAAASAVDLLTPLCKTWSPFHVHVMVHGNHVIL